MKKFELFPTPVMEFNFTNHPDLPSLLNIMEDQPMNQFPILKNGSTSYGIGMTDILLFPELVGLKNDFQKSVDKYSTDIMIRRSYIVQSWFNKMEHNGQTFLHHHGSSVISGAFYPVLEENTCNLLFRSPLYTALNFESDCPTPSNHFQPDFAMPLKKDHLYIFPSWLQHHTEVNKGGKRVVISFNTKFY